MYTIEQNRSVNYTPYKGVSTAKIGGLNKAHKVIKGREALERIEDAFMAISFKANRSVNQCNERRAKRHKV